MSTNKKEKKESSPLKSKFAAIVIPVCLIVSILTYKYVLGAPSNFKGGNPENMPLPGNYLGMMYKGGFIVPILMCLVLLVIVFSIERMITINRATGKGRLENFVRKIRAHLNAGNIDAAIRECDLQKGSVANVVRAGLEKYKAMEKEPEMELEQKTLAIQKEIEEATTLEMPALEKNLPILATIASISTLIGLLGTVLGMIRAFAALGESGASAADALAVGISEALINTATGITASALAIIFYNYFTGRIDKLTYSIDESGFSIVQSFAASHSSKQSA
ncbi:MAG: MotA/TolQ/ExbB proton channel family protein [Bacteroidia bacterium]|nr:MotA/TolQ/ExbB proton channel family protein [Bacteroidia bacterium]MDW8301694.1 MotA/TolQ/ExbB proton channel family protein [Bacteroidia bacterium]